MCTMVVQRTMYRILLCYPNTRLVLMFNLSTHLLIFFYHLIGYVYTPQAAFSAQNRVFHANIVEEHPRDTHILDLNKELQADNSASFTYSQFAIVASNPLISRFVHMNAQSGILSSAKKIDRDVLCNRYKLCCPLSDSQRRTDPGSLIAQSFHRTADTCQLIFRVIFKAVSQMPSSSSLQAIGSETATHSNQTAQNQEHSTEKTEYCTVVVNIIDVNDNVPRFVLPRDLDRSLHPEPSSGSIRSLSYEPVAAIELSVSELTEVGTCFKLPTAVDEDSSPYSIHEYRMDKLSPSELIPVERHLINRTKSMDLFESQQLFSLVQSTCDPITWTKASYHSGQGATRAQSMGSRGDSLRTDSQISSGSHPSVAYLRLTSKLDRESREEHWLKVLALDGPVDSMTTSQLPFTSGRQSMTFRRHTGTLLIRIRVLDANDNDPEVSPRLEFQVPENTKIGSVIGVISGTDRDLGEFGRLHYRLEMDGQSVDAIPFAVNPNTGTITVNRPLDADRMPEDSNRQHRFRVICSDSAPAGQQRSATTEVTVQLVNVNDETPQIKVIDLQSRSNPPQPTVAENRRPGQLVAFVTASDADSGLHGTINCHVSNNKFQLELINSGFQTSSASTSSSLSSSASLSSLTGAAFDQFLQTGSNTANDIEFQLVTRVSLDREQSAIEHVEIVCTDQALVSTDVRTGRIAFTVLVLDENDNDPQFTTDLIRIRLVENSPVNQLVAVLNATDADQLPPSAGSPHWYGMNYLPNGLDYHNQAMSIPNRLTYILDAKGEKYFRLDTQTGALYSRVQFDREVTAQLEFNVTVVDGGVPARSVTAQVQLIVLDENDNAPQFEREFYEIELLESVPTGQVIANVHATDRDSGINAELIYQMEDLMGKAQRYFKLNSRNGTLRLFTPLDREKQDGFTFRVFAFDRGTPKQSSFCTLSIRVMDVNDNAPQFVYPTQKNHTIYASAYTPPGIPLVKLTAVDPDEGENARLSFHLDGDSTQAKIFNLDDKSGELCLRGLSDPSESVGTYQLKLRVTDSGTPALSGHASINIVLNKNSHTFSKYSMHPQMLDKTVDNSFINGESNIKNQPGQNNRSSIPEHLTRADRTELGGGELNNYYHQQPLEGSADQEGLDTWNGATSHALSYFSSERALIIIICLIAISAVIAFLFLVAIVIVRRKAVAVHTPRRSDNTGTMPRIVNTCTPPAPPWFGSNKSGSTPSASFASNKTWLITAADKSYSPTAQPSVDYVQRGSCPLGETGGPEMLELDKRPEQTNFPFCNETLEKTIESHRYTPNRADLSALQRTPCLLLSTNDFNSHVNLHRVDDHLTYKCAATDSSGSSPAGRENAPFQTTYQTIDDRGWTKRRGLDRSSPIRAEAHTLIPRVKFAEIDPAYQDLQFATVRDPPGLLELPANRSMPTIQSNVQQHLANTNEK